MRNCAGQDGIDVAPSNYIFSEEKYVIVTMAASFKKILQYICVILVIAFDSNNGGYKLGPPSAKNLTMPSWYTNNEPRPAGKRTAFTTEPFYKKEDPLISSGLIGLVSIQFSKAITSETLYE
ncbi:hypothetical protein [Spongiivirga citrea]|uniref:Uncharacterized protein n=1 Tax=Spongiivirga citrea TaxID=1481457 RepID=A0A6M0CVN3_9FLAO|nr:hypothetical protein [Spongiivirga citrea]NER17820.1 hypothetical protein [Spongiivirga citrea]